MPERVERTTHGNRQSQFNPSLRARIAEASAKKWSPLPTEFAELSLQDAVEGGRPFEDRANVLRDRFEFQTENLDDRYAKMRSASNLAVQSKLSSKQRGPQGFARQLGQAERRGRARQQLHDRGEAALRNQQLKDRMTLIKQTLSKRGMAMDAASNAARIRAGGQEQIASAKAWGDAQVAGAVGAVAGGLARQIGGSNNKSWDGSAGMAEQQGFVDQFFGSNWGEAGWDNTYTPDYGFGTSPTWNT